ncbi:MAG: S-adenosylmethionine decarboxylase, partial [Candidatus Peribacteraceae bacterium]|nr:S-adenosylmethionine decarboxylase [Candidatus Peribacteraceae bacterium]
MVVLLESHMSLHTWPENGFMRLELSSCRRLAPEILILVGDYLQAWFGGEQIYKGSEW